MKSLMSLWEQVSNELGARCDTSTTLDYNYVKSRVEHEGESFLTISLPAFCKDFEKSLEDGKVADDSFLSFRRTSGLPRFLGGFLQRVFDRSTGALVDVPCVDSIFAIRQLTLMFAKIEKPCSSERVSRAISRYIDCEQEVRNADRSTSVEDLESFGKMSALLFRDVFTKIDELVAYGGVSGLSNHSESLVPKHGPGVTVDKLLGNKKYNQVEWTERLESVFPYLDNALPSPSYYQQLDRVTFLEPGAERPVKVITVPKTLKTPRIIAIEPTCMQYMQQALMEKFVEYLETDSTVSGMIGFIDQTPNQRLALEGSKDGSLATLDLSEASDRVSNQHVRTMLRHHPHLFEAVDATRSRKADVPGHGVIRLAKFASMGSALCFPMEAMVFLTIIFLGIQDVHNAQLTRNSIKRFSGKVRVYGDDLIIPIDYVYAVHQRLEAFGFRVNADKSFWNGKFRESCGKEYYDGEDVSIVRVRTDFPSSRHNVREIIATVSLRNRFYFAGLWKTAAALDCSLKEVLIHFPTVWPESPVLGRHSLLPYQVDRLESGRYQQPVVTGWVVRSVLPASRVDGTGALLKWFLKRGDLPFADRDHLERSGRPLSVNIKKGRFRPY